MFVSNEEDDDDDEDPKVWTDVVVVSTTSSCRRPTLQMRFLQFKNEVQPQTLVESAKMSSLCYEQ